MTGNENGAAALIKKHVNLLNPEQVVLKVHCIIHQEAVWKSIEDESCDGCSYKSCQRNPCQGIETNFGHSWKNWTQTTKTYSTTAKFAGLAKERSLSDSSYCAKKYFDGEEF